jgi:prolyl oligopeptidase
MSDKYKSLESLEDGTTVDFYTQHNSSTDRYFKNTGLEYFTRELARIGDVDLRGLPYQFKKHMFWIQRDRDWQKPKLMHAVGKDDPEILLDFDASPETLDYWCPSPDGTKLIYGTSENGNEETALHVMRVRDKVELTSPIPFAGYTDQGTIVWLSDNTFIYPRMNGFSQKGPRDKWLLGTKLYRHTIGTDAKDDQLVYGMYSSDTVMLIPTLSSDKTRLYIASCEDELTHQVHITDIASGKSQEITSQEKASFTIRSAHGKVYALTNYQAPRYRLLMCEEDDVEMSFDDWDEALPENDDILQEFWVHRSGQIIAQYSHNVSSRLNVYDAYGNQDAVIHLPKFSVVQGVSCNDKSQHIYYSVSGFVQPTTHFKLETPLSEPELSWQREVLQGDADIAMEQLTAISNDGTEIPYFSICKKTVETSVPTIIYGYGGFNIALEPSYLSAMRPWVLAGGRVVFANLRGGSEFGEEWHKAGAMENKQNTFNDCVSVAEDLVSKKLTSTRSVGVMGGSNGGLLVSAVTVQRPDLFRAGAALVPLTDMFEFYKHQVAEFWVHEYGDPRIPEQRSWIEKWSPYHYPIDSSLSFPALYYETALHDARVHPFHAFKMVARLNEHVTGWKGPLLLRTWTDTGHQSSNLTKDDHARRSAEVYAFFAQELGLVIPASS